MADNRYAAWSLHDLKAAAAAAKPSGLERDVTSFADGESAMLAVREQFDAALAALSDSWTGTAAQAATTNARAAIATLTDTSQTAAATSGAVVGYAQSVRDAQRAVAAIPDKSFDWGEAFAAGGFAGPIGIGGDALKQAVEAEQHRNRAAELVEQMDHAGRAHANVMKAMPWVSHDGSFEKPAALTPPPDAAKSDRSTTARAGSHTSAYVGTTSRVRTAHDKSFVAEERSAGRHHDARIESVRKVGESPITDTTSMSGGVDTPAPHPQPNFAAGPPSPAAPVAEPSAGTSAALSGAGFALGSTGVAAGRLATVAGRGVTVVGGHGIASEGPSDSSDASKGRLRAGQSDTAERPGGRIDAEPRTANTSRAQLSEVAMRERGASPGGGYPLGAAAGQRRDDEDELRARPEFLVESDDIWGDGRTALPPVLG